MERKPKLPEITRMVRVSAKDQVNSTKSINRWTAIALAFFFSKPIYDFFIYPFYFEYKMRKRQSMIDAGLITEKTIEEYLQEKANITEDTEESQES